ncbi:MAG: hypothetical protein ACXABL_13470 [Candidatus Thorarchaeota archaeon]
MSITKRNALLLYHGAIVLFSAAIIASCAVVSYVGMGYQSVLVLTAISVLLLVNLVSVGVLRKLMGYIEWGLRLE